MISKERLEAIKAYEDIYDEVTAAVEECEKSLEKLEGLREQVRKLTEYSSSGEWLRDYEADEAGEIPEDLKRGILSQDGLYDLLGRFYDLAMRIE